MSLRQQLLAHMADGHFHSGESLGRQLGVSRSAIWKALRGFSELGLELDAVSGRGYRLRMPIQLLRAETILAQLPPETRSRLEALEVFDEIDSTNRYLIQHAHSGARQPRVCFAERQSEGRGRRGRQWCSPYGHNLYFSLHWFYEIAPEALAGISLALSVALAETLSGEGVAGLQLKWPNDLQWRGRKLAGILLEMAGETSGPCHLVVGVGLNLYLPPEQAREVDQPWVDLHQILGHYPQRNRLAARLTDSLVQVMGRYGEQGLQPYLKRWPQYDALRGRPIDLHLGERVLSGVARGVSDDGGLRVETSEGLRTFHSGEVSVRVAS